MKNKIQNTECQKFETILALIFKNKVNIRDYIFFRQHMQKCKICEEKYFFIKRIFKDFNEIKAETKTVTNPLMKYSINEYKNMEENLSGYIDKELSPKENLAVKKLLIGNSHVKANFIKINKLIQLLKNDAENYKNKIWLRERIRNFKYFFGKNK